MPINPEEVNPVAFDFAFAERLWDNMEKSQRRDKEQKKGWIRGTRARGKQKKTRKRKRIKIRQRKAEGEKKTENSSECKETQHKRSKTNSELDRSAVSPSSSIEITKTGHLGWRGRVASKKLQQRTPISKAARKRKLVKLKLQLSLNLIRLSTSTVSSLSAPEFVFLSNSSSAELFLCSFPSSCFASLLVLFACFSPSLWCSVNDNSV